VLFNVSKRRILTKLSSKASVDLQTPPDALTMGAFLDHQRFIPQAGEAMRLIRALLADRSLEPRARCRARPSDYPARNESTGLYTMARHAEIQQAAIAHAPSADAAIA
jgi:hypothetical protein